MNRPLPIASGILAAGLGAVLALASVAPGRAADTVVFRYGFAPDRVGLEASGWYADNTPESGHATDVEDQYDYSRITIGLMNNFIRAFLYKIEDRPGIRTPGRVTLRLRRLGQSSKIILMASGQGVCTYLQKDPQADRYEITGGTNAIPLYWGSRSLLQEWHDYSIEYDGQKRIFSIDGDPSTRMELKSTPAPDADFLSLGMGYEYGKDMYIDVESLRFDPPGSPLTKPALSPRKDGPFLASYPGGEKRIECSFAGGTLSGRLIRWHRNGQKQAEGMVADDRPDGDWTWWYPDGRVRLTAHYDKGVLNGQYLRYYPDGQAETIVRYRDGRADGLFARWFPDGQPKFVGGYRADAMEGPWTQWNSNGSPEWAHMSADNKHDVFVKLWHPNGLLKMVKYIDHGIDHGRFEEYHANGQIKLRGQYQQGRKAGVWTTYDEQGKPIQTEDINWR
jgi:antitoxin component YwqK of YwqJK toxin-antitoxin module